jgi:sucrose-6-phosphate hydrolase SacC (GH32 family)
MITINVTSVTQHRWYLPYCAAAATPDDPDLKDWVKLPGEFLPQPAAALQLTGWRDPFILERPSGSSPWWYVMVGAGVKDKCGTALVYRSRDLKHGTWDVMLMFWMYVCLAVPPGSL